MQGHHGERVAEALREELEELIGFELEDPRIHGVTVSQVHLSPDGKLASVAVLIEGSAQEKVRILEALQHAKPFLKSQLASRIRLYKIPDLRFEPAVDLAIQDRIPQLRRRMRRGRPRDGETAEKTQK